MSVPRFEKDDVSAEARLEAQRSNDSSQPGMPIYHRRLANPAPLGLLSFATSVFLVSLTGVGTRGVEEPNIIITTMIFFGGICQYIAGIMEFVSGNTVSTQNPTTSQAPFQSAEYFDSWGQLCSPATLASMLPMHSYSSLVLAFWLHTLTLHRGNRCRSSIRR